MPTRRVRRPARPLDSQFTGFKGHVQRFFLSFTPKYFKDYWLGKAGLIRLAKLAGAGFLFIFLVFLWYAKDLPSPAKINNGKLGLTTTFYARDELTNPGKGTKLYEVHGNQNRLLIGFNQMPETIKQATIAIEDKNFYKEGAFSVSGMGRAFTGVVTRNSSAGGGSTITQQYVKNALLTNDNIYSRKFLDLYSRKIKELILSIEINQFYSKNDILKLYLNEIPYGNGAYGIEAACRTYFSDKYGKTSCAEHLNLGESALLAAVPNLPSYFNPYGQHKQELIDRQHLILRKMVEQGYVSQAKADEAKWTLAMLDNTAGNKALAINKTPSFYSAVTAPNFVYTVQDQLEEKYGAARVEQGGWKVITSLDPNLQRCAELAIYNPGNESCKPDGKAAVNPNARNSSYTNLLRNKGSNAALVASNPANGQVLAMVGSYSFAESQVNVATRPRQPGSSFKPFVYAALFGKNKDATCTANTTTCATYGAGSILSDTIATADSFDKNYKPRDFGGSTEVGGPVTVRTALAGSLNIPAVQALSLAGVSNSITTARNMGITTLNKPASTYGLSLVLGSGEVKLADHVNAYESFANGGVHYDPTMVLKIYDSRDKVLEDNTKPATPKKVLDPQVAYLITSMLSDAGARSYIFGSSLNVPGHSASGQGGQGVAVKTGTTEHFNDAWTVGYTPSIVAGVWAGNNDNKPMTSQAADISAPIWKGFMSAALNSKPIETFNRPAGLQYLPNAGGALRATSSSDFYPKWYKQQARKYVSMDKVSGKLATDCTPPLAREQQLSTGITQTDDAHSCADVKPTVSLNGTSGSGPYNNVAANVTLGTFGTAKQGIGSAQLQVYLDDQIVYTKQISASDTYPITGIAPTAGSHVIKAIVTDTGLYQGSDEDTINASGTNGSGFQGLSPTDGATLPPGSISFAWSSNEGASQYRLYVDGSPRGGPTASTSRSATVLSSGGHTWYVQDDNGVKTPDLSFNIE